MPADTALTHSIWCGVHTFVFTVNSTSTECIPSDGTSSEGQSKQVPIQQRNKKDQLYNDILSYCEKNQIGWIGDEVDVTFLRSVTDVLWYIDGHHHVFAGRGVHVPDSFSRLNTINV